MPWGAAVGALVGSVANNVLSDDQPSVSDRPSMTPEQQQALRNLLARLQGPNAPGMAPYTATLNVTPSGQPSLTALEQFSQDMMRSRIDTGLDNTNIDQMFQDSVEQPAIRNFNQDVIPAIDKGYKGNSIFSSDRALARGRAGGDLASSLTAARSKMAFDASEAAKNRQIQRQGLAINQNQAIDQLLGQIFGGHITQDAAIQSGLDRTYQEFVRQQGAQNTNVSQILAALGLQPLNTVVTPGQPGLLTSAAPGIGQALTQYWLNQNLRNNNYGRSSGDNGVTPNQGDTFGSP